MQTSILHHPRQKHKAHSDCKKCLDGMLSCPLLGLLQLLHWQIDLSSSVEWVPKVEEAKFSVVFSSEAYLLLWAANNFWF